MRIFTATLGTETNTFSPIPAGWKAFEDVMLRRPGEHPDFVTEGTGPLWACREREASDGWDIVEGTCAFAMPAGPVSRLVYETIRDEILTQLQAALPVDAVALGLHGAMMARGVMDCEGDILRRVRQIVGPDVPVGAVLDLHAHLTNAMTHFANFLIFFKEYPHIDYLERSRELLELLVRHKIGDIKPDMQVFDCKMIQGMNTTIEPGLGFVQSMKDLEQQPAILSISAVHGFGAADNPDMGSKILVITNDEPDHGKAIARSLGERFYRLREELEGAPNESYQVTLDRVLQEATLPIILVDASDNPCGGTAGDHTHILQELHQRGIRGVCLGPMWDPIAVSFCHDAGVGARLHLRIGGKGSPTSGEPLDVHVVVTGLKKNARQVLGTASTPLGDTAAVNFDGIDVVLSGLRDQTYGPDLFTDVGIDPYNRKIIVVKSTQQFRIGFSKFKGEIVTLSRGIPLAKRGFKNIARPMWPFDPDPLELDGT